MLAPGWKTPPVSVGVIARCPCFDRTMRLPLWHGAIVLHSPVLCGARAAEGSARRPNPLPYPLAAEGGHCDIRPTGEMRLPRWPVSGVEPVQHVRGVRLSAAVGVARLCQGVQILVTHIGHVLAVETRAVQVTQPTARRQRLLEDGGAQVPNLLRVSGGR
eukprot:scaffold1453_cov112-Isochrysis_galbana.AAC.24